jgi:hypothetical protein
MEDVIVTEVYQLGWNHVHFPHRKNSRAKLFVTVYRMGQRLKRTPRRQYDYVIDCPFTRDADPDEMYRFRHQVEEAFRPFAGEFIHTMFDFEARALVSGNIRVNNRVISQEEALRSGVDPRLVNWAKEIHRTAVAMQGRPGWPYHWRAMPR